ncbi:DUF2621 domain-containing protein [Laceyella sacchari]|uniref:DUF2621 domain-containing protein n=2 Tax=Laceyella TaxID=292635 RepID=A0AA46ACN3_9BACL|nr:MULTISPECIES: DUF2621 family protein [Laceyella]AUS07858.1 DUF2621 domain-containing protein [Laceyella sacchari]PRZ13992.1 uncharacterized protein DUF2621 [Laceyella sediminis]SMP00321.1 Protein of unknown function [Laceyella tengchongensis]
MTGPIWLQWFYVLFWIALISLMAIGGYFMFRKFLKALPKADGKSILDWQEYYIKETLHLWTDEHKALLNDLVSPVPELFRDVAKQTIAGKIGELVVKEEAKQLSQDHIIRGYILATPKRDHKFLIKKLKERNIDISPYQELLK